MVDEDGRSFEEQFVCDPKPNIGASKAGMTFSQENSETMSDHYLMDWLIMTS